MLAGRVDSICPVHLNWWGLASSSIWFQCGARRKGGCLTVRRKIQPTVPLNSPQEARDGCWPCCPIPKPLSICSDASSLEKNTNLQLGRNACNAAFLTRVWSAAPGCRLSTSLALLEEVQPDPSWAGPLYQAFVLVPLLKPGPCQRPCVARRP